MEETPVVLFDGVCKFCNAAVNFILDHDKSKQIRFAAQQSEAGQALLRKYQLADKTLKSLVYISNGKLYQKSSAALAIAIQMGGIYGWLARMGYLVPTFFRDGVYDYIAANRYRWWGKSDACIIPSPEIKARFLD
jgi:predicted DCC family thiol-disulfide oxidoreductase YuxK